MLFFRLSQSLLFYGYGGFEFITNLFSSTIHNQVNFSAGMSPEKKELASSPLKLFYGYNLFNHKPFPAIPTLGWFQKSTFASLVLYGILAPFDSCSLICDLGILFLVPYPHKSFQE